jgi:nitroimidazol reductase NimA-like FMN-containing flavoprotein (pyridoxamine 5'-phosphate oxidase superfamily)
LKEDETMSMDSMRRQDRMISDPEAKSILENRKIGRIGLCIEGQPYVVPVLYLYSSEDDCIYVHSATKGRKMETLGRNPKVCFEVDKLKRIIIGEKVCNCTAEYESVIAFGKASLVNQEKRTEILHRMIQKYGVKTKLNTPIDKETLTKTAVIKISIDRITGKANPP